MDESYKYWVKYYSNDDLSVGHHLTIAGELLDKIDYNKNNSINELFEFLNISLYFKNNLYLSSWETNLKDRYNKIVEDKCKELKSNLIRIDYNKILTIIEELNYCYYDDFWKLINDLGIYASLGVVNIERVLSKHSGQINNIIKQNKLVEKYDYTIRDFLVKYEGTAPLILSNYEEKKDQRSKPKIFLPKSLTHNDIEQIIVNYLNSADPNLNYVRLIENSKDNIIFKLSTKTRLRAKKVSKKLNEKVLQSSHKSSIGVSVTISKEQVEPVLFNSTNGNFQVSYSEFYIDYAINSENLSILFKDLFSFLDENNLIYMVSKPSELIVLEKILIRSKNEYETGFMFWRKENLSFVQIVVIDNYLKEKGKCIEELINQHVKFINNKFLKSNKLTFKIPISNNSYLEKIRYLAPDFEFLLKQYKTLVEESKIDLELIQFGSHPLNIGEVPSKKTIKYLYLNDNNLHNLKYQFFSDQSGLSYVKQFENKYDNLYDLLSNETVNYNCFKNYQKQIIDTLIGEHYLKITKKNSVIIFKKVLISLIGKFYRNDVVSYWNSSNHERKELDKLISENKVIIECTLFSRQERNYFNYYLNMKEYTNGFDLRNKYLHGSNSLSWKNIKLITTDY